MIQVSKRLIERIRARTSAVASRVVSTEQGPADPLLMGLVVALVAFGVVMVYSASAVFASQTFHNGQYFLIRQGIFATIGILLIVSIAHFDYHRLRALTYPVLGMCVLLLSYVAFGGGHAAGGAARWIAIGPIHVQPAEMTKVAMILWLAKSLSSKSERIGTFSVGFLPHVLVALFMMALCMKQPDFGSAVMIGALTMMMLVAAGVKIGYVGVSIMALVPVAVLAVSTSEYRMRRIKAFLEPFEHRYDIGYQISESLMSFGSGGLTGAGLGDSRQKLFFLPEAHTDFISAIVGEELGFVGIACLIVAFGALVVLGTRIAFRAADAYGTYLATGITLFVGLQSFTNLAVAMGLVPTKGLVLPFISYGGSSLLVNCAAMGVLLNVSRARPDGAEKPKPDAPRSSRSERISNVRFGHGARVARAGGQR
jgi:cell division protein FtsW